MTFSKGNMMMLFNDTSVRLEYIYLFLNYPISQGIFNESPAKKVGRMSACLILYAPRGFGNSGMGLFFVREFGKKNKIVREFGKRRNIVISFEKIEKIALEFGNRPPPLVEGDCYTLDCLINWGVLSIFNSTRV